MPRLEALSQVQRRMLEFFPCMEFDDTPWTPLSQPLSESRMAIVTTAGLHLRDDKPFNRDHPGGESTYRIIPSDADPADIVQSHFSIGFDRTAIYRDLNVTYPTTASANWPPRASSAASPPTITPLWAPSATAPPSPSAPAPRRPSACATKALTWRCSPPLDPSAPTP